MCVIKLAISPQELPLYTFMNKADFFINLNRTGVIISNTQPDSVQIHFHKRITKQYSQRTVSAPSAG